jgi:hypothetical protein
LKAFCLLLLSTSLLRLFGSTRRWRDINYQTERPVLGSLDIDAFKIGQHLSYGRRQQSIAFARLLNSMLKNRLLVLLGVGCGCGVKVFPPLATLPAAWISGFAFLKWHCFLLMSNVSLFLFRAPPACSLPLTSSLCH